MKAFVLALGALLGLLLGAGCSGGKQCAPNDALVCVQDAANPDGATYWLDSCGQLLGLSKVCECGCDASASGCRPCVCEPDCTDRQCGPDGCGGQCPPGCADHQVCSDAGSCESCVPDCAGRHCGSDGCGGDCPPGCDAGEGCDLDGQCVPCQPACAGRECGPDGCGGRCTPGCDDGEICNPAGLCEVCRPDCGGRECGPDGCGGSCPPGCAEGQVCTDAGECSDCSPSCDGRDCGSDGCGGKCGICDEGLACDQTGACTDVACSGQPESVSGRLNTSATNPAFDTATVSLAHRRDLDPAQDGCLNEIDIELGLSGGCRLAITARDRYLVGQGLEIRQVGFTADQACPGLDLEDLGEYGGLAGLTTAHVTPSVLEVPDVNAYSSCLALGLVIELAGQLTRDGDGAVLEVMPSRIEIFGEFISMGDPLAACPCLSDCRDKACGDDGCGVQCGHCPGPTDYCDPSFACVDDCAGRVCGPSPVMGFDCGQCPGLYEACIDGVCTCPNTVCLGECCGPDAICTQGGCCLPDCLGRQCGADGCGGSCGTCFEDLSCVDGLCLADPEWVLIEGGTFMMGSAPGTGVANEEPEHEVTLPSFELLRTEVTVGQYLQCIDANACEVEPMGPRCTLLEQANLPINCLNVYGAEQYCAWAGGRLPTEAEWEYAARSRGLDDTYPWGGVAPSCGLAIFDDSGGSHLSGCGTDMPWPVCSVPAGNTEQGLCDMAGNVAEIVADHLHDDYVGAPADGSAWLGGEDDAARLARGGHFNDPDPLDLRTRVRKPFSYYWFEPFFGIRCARDVQ